MVEVVAWCSVMLDMVVVLFGNALLRLGRDRVSPWKSEVNVGGDDPMNDKNAYL